MLFAVEDAARKLVNSACLVAPRLVINAKMERHDLSIENRR
jgi:hypothetical protein